MTDRQVADPAQERALRSGVVEFAASPPGALTWSPARNADVPEDRIVREAFRFLASRAGLSPAGARELGRSMGGQARARDLASYLDAFSHLGLGRLELASEDGGRFVIRGHDLSGSHEPKSPSCALALGFVEGAIGALDGSDAALGAEMLCRSRGHAHCAFHVRAKR